MSSWGRCIRASPSFRDEKAVQHSPPTRLRRFDLILVDEGSQIKDHVAKKIYMGITELAQKPFVGIAPIVLLLRHSLGGKPTLTLGA